MGPIVKLKSTVQIDRHLCKEFVCLKELKSEI